MVQFLECDIVRDFETLTDKVVAAGDGDYPAGPGRKERRGYWISVASDMYQSVSDLINAVIEVKGQIESQHPNPTIHDYIAGLSEQFGFVLTEHEARVINQQVYR